MTSSDTPTNPELLQAEIEQTRAELGETVQELTAKTDVRTRARQAVGNATGRVRQKLAGSGSNLPVPIRRPLPLAAIAAAAAVVVASVVVARRRRS